MGGNIQTKTRRELSSGTIINPINYTYGNNNWKDQLTSFNGNTITYDAIGNPLTYNGNTYTWTNGRELQSINNGFNTYQYKYNESGIRISKTINNVETKYYLDGNSIIYECKTDDCIYYTYDGEGVSGFTYINNQYYYVKNIQGDVIGILDNNLERIVSYEYSSWGEILSVKDSQGVEITNPTHIGLINPFRYRSYYYDTETQMYYLNSRYYNPEIGRFINADEILESGHEVLGNNLYTYVSNNPVMGYDPNGNINFWDLFDVGSFVDSLVTFVKKPSWSNAGWLALDTFGLLPLAPGAGTVKAGSKIVSGANKISNTKKVTKNYTNNIVPKFNLNQQAVIQLGKEARKSGGITMKEAQILVKWGKEYNVPNVRIDIPHIGHSGIFSQCMHVHVNKDHIRIFPE